MNRKSNPVILFLFFCCSTLLSYSQGYEIKVKVDDYTQGKLLLGYQYGNKSYLKDTVEADKTGNFIFRGKEPLKPGIYYITSFQGEEILTILCDEKNQRFSVKTTFNNSVKNAVFTGSAENKDFNDYRQFLAVRKQSVNELNAKMEDPSIDAIASAAIEKKLKALDSAVRKYQRNFIAQNPTSYTALIIKAGIDPVPPVFTGSEKEKNLQLLYWTRDHVFDNVNLAEEKLLRTSILTSKVDYFLDNLTSQNPDSIKPAIDKIAALTRASKPNYQFFMTDLLNKYAKSEIIGMDAVYVHIALTYYDNGKADWMEKNNLDKILTSARALEPVLIGKIAPDFEISDMNNQKITLKDFKAEFTILFFLSPGCDYCRSTAGYVRKVAERFSDKGVRVLTVYGSTGLTENVEDWKRFITQNKLESFTNTADFLNGGLIKSRYNIRATPQLFILGKNKKILFKNLSGEKLEEVMVYVLQHAG